MNMAKKVDKPEPIRMAIPADGMSRWKQFAPFSPFSREKFRQLVIAGKAPQPVRFSDRCTAYHNQELLKFLADPLNYSAAAVRADKAGAIASSVEGK
jgi:prophage regulatory protein